MKIKSIYLLPIIMMVLLVSFCRIKTNETNDLEKKESLINIGDLMKAALNPSNEVWEQYLADNGFKYWQVDGVDSDFDHYTKNLELKTKEIEVGRFGVDEPVKETIFVPDNPKGNSISIEMGAYRGPYTVYISIWGEDMYNDFLDQLKQLGYSEKESGRFSKEAAEGLPSEVSLGKSEGSDFPNKYLFNLHISYSL